jgi:ElaB/YqjD/DUF883 family membrane-anchored ribosome-binding protein
MKRIQLYDYVAINNPSGGAKVIEHFNLKKPTSRREIGRGLRYVMINFGEEGFREIAKAHPDRALILDSVAQDKVFPMEQKSEACGCSSNANGEENKKEEGASNQDIVDAIKESSKSSEDDTKKETQLTKDDISNEIKKAFDKHKPFIKDTLPYLAVGGVALFLFIGAISKK